MDDNVEGLRTVTLHNGVSMPTLAFGTAFGDWVGATDFQGFLPEQGMVMTAYAHFASGVFGLLQDPVLVAIAARHGKAAGQIVLRWQVQSGRTALPKTSKAKRMAENQDIYDFALSDEEMQAIDALGAGEARRTCPDPSNVV